MLLIKLIRESLIFSILAIAANKTRTLLSLLGITIGIFCVISVFTVFDSIESTIRGSIESLGSNVLFIQKWPWAMGGRDYPWWKYMKRPEPKLSELADIMHRSQTTSASAFMASTSRNVTHGSNVVERTGVIGISHEYYQVINFELEQGRYFTPIESASGRNVAIIGNSISTNLFSGNSPLGKNITIWGRKLEVIGVLKREGKSNFGNSTDEQVLIPINFARTFIDLNGGNSGSTIVVKGKPQVSNEEMKDELTGILRSIRRLKPSAEDDFSINETSIISQGFDSLFSVVSIVGWIIGGFSLLVGGFGIANIMFVSVKERTGIIGIQKSVGAKNYFVLLQFLFEAIFLSVLGGIIGLTVVFLGTLVAGYLLDMELMLTAKNIMLGVTVSAIIGLVSGIVPAWSASRLDPVEAMRSTF